MIRQAVELKVKTTVYSTILKVLLPFLLVFGLLFTIVFFLLMMADQLTGEQKNPVQGGKATNVSKEVLRYQSTVKKYTKEYGISQYTDIILAIMMQESGGRGDDPMQASESHCGTVGCIKKPEKSIQLGTKNFAQQLKKAKGDLKTAIQSYNFGGGFIDYVNQRGGHYTKELAMNFSKRQYQKLAHTGIYHCIRPEAVPVNACYGDVGYVDAVLKYYDFTSPVQGKGKWTTPIEGAVEVTSGFGTRTWEDGSKENHKGLDFGCINRVTPIYAPRKGKVIYSEFHKNKNGAPGYGNLVILQHGKGLYTGYAHLFETNVREGQAIKEGQQIGVCGSTGHSTGPHLHFEVKTSEWGGHLNPQSVLDFRGR